MKGFLKRKVGKLFGFSKEIERLEMALVAVSVATQANTRQAAIQQRLSEDSPWFCAAVADVHHAVNREIALREELQAANERFSFSISARDNLREALRRKSGECEDLKIKIIELESLGSKLTLIDPLSTKNCIKCGSEMIPLRSEDKKLCSNGACGHEIEWLLEEGQEYMHKRNVEPFVEDRSNVSLRREIEEE